MRRDVKKKRLSIQSMHLKAKELKKLHEIQNVILANCAYHERESSLQLEKISHTATTEEIKLIKDTWDKRNELATELQNELRKWLDANNTDKRQA